MSVLGPAANSSKASEASEYETAEESRASLLSNHTTSTAAASVATGKRKDLAVSIGWLGRMLAVSMLPLMGFTALLALRFALDANWSWWLICLPLILLILLLFLLTSAFRPASPVMVRLSWTSALLMHFSFLLIFLARHSWGSQSAFLQSNILLFSPHWLLGLLFFSFGLVSLWRCRRSQGAGIRSSYRRVRDLGVDPSDTPATHGAIAFFLILLGVLYTTVSVLCYVHFLYPQQITWPIVFAPWWAADCFAFLVGVLLLLFSLGARDSVLFPLYQQVIYILCCTAAALLKGAVAVEEEHEINGPPSSMSSSAWNDSLGPYRYTTIGLAFAFEFLLMSCGLSLCFGRNRKAPVFEVTDTQSVQVVSPALIEERDPSPR